MYARSYTRYVVIVLTLTYVLNQLDRAVFGMLMEPIRRQFALTDTQLGFLAGPALVVLYSCLGVPVARQADRSRRVTIMVGAVALWSAITMLTAAVHAFWQLAAVRIGVGVGEAGFSAVALSVIGDYESDERRTQAVSNFMLAIPIAWLITDLMGGWVNQLYGWRPVFVIAGAPGILMALLLMVTVREPPRRAESAAEVARVPLRLALATLWRLRSLRYLVIAQGLANIAAVTGNWLSVFFIRQHHMTTGELGSWFAFTDSVGGLTSIWLSGFAVSRLGVKDARVKTRLMAYAAMLVAPVALCILYSPSKYAALAFCLLLNVPMFFFLAPSVALAQDLVGANMRATVTSFFILVQLLAGGVFGTQLVGILSDVLIPIAGDSAEALRWSMTITFGVSLVAAMFFGRAGRFVREDSAAVHGGATTAYAVP
jgi:MFS family permease